MSFLKSLCLCLWVSTVHFEVGEVRNIIYLSPPRPSLQLCSSFEIQILESISQACDGKLPNPSQSFYDWHLNTRSFLFFPIDHLKEKKKQIQRLAVTSLARHFFSAVLNMLFIKSFYFSLTEWTKQNHNQPTVKTQTTAVNIQKNHGVEKYKTLACHYRAPGLGDLLHHHHPVLTQLLKKKHAGARKHAGTAWTLCKSASQSNVQHGEATTAFYTSAAMKNYPLYPQCTWSESQLSCFYSHSNGVVLKGKKKSLQTFPVCI